MKNMIKVLVLAVAMITFNHILHVCLFFIRS